MTLQYKTVSNINLSNIHQILHFKVMNLTSEFDHRSFKNILSKPYLHLNIMFHVKLKLITILRDNKILISPHHKISIILHKKHKSPFQIFYLLKMIGKHFQAKMGMIFLEMSATDLQSIN